MEDSGKEVFVFTWRIENFSLCPQQTGRRLESPTFKVDFLDCEEWQLWMYPRGNDSNNNVIFFLSRIFSNRMIIGFTLTLASVTGKEVRITLDRYVFEDGKNCGSLAYFTRKNILNIANGHLPNDILTVRCELWRVEELLSENAQFSGFEDNPVIFKQIQAAVIRDEIVNFRTQFGSLQCTAVTRINVRKKSVLWPIRRFSELRQNTKLSIPIVIVVEEIPLFSLTFYIGGENVIDHRAQIEIERNDNHDDDYFVKCKIIAFSAMNRCRYVKEDEHYFSSNAKDIWKFPSSFVDISKLKEEKYLVLGQDILYLSCEFALSTLGVVSHVEMTDFVQISSLIPFLSPVPSDSLGPVFKYMCKDGKFTDVILRTRDREFKVHKIILVAQSAVFGAIFENDMPDKDIKIKYIADVDADTMDRTLDFMYTGELKVANDTDFVKFYSVAVKYQIQSLRWLCSCFLRSILSVSNICSLLNLAFLHQDDELMNELKSYIFANSTEVFHSITWEDFMQSNFKLAGEIMLEILRMNTSR